MDTSTATERGRVDDIDGRRRSRELLDPARPDDRRLTATVRAALRRPAAEVLDWAVEPVAYVSGTPSTGGLFRVRGTARDPADSRGAVLPWSIFVKLLQSPTRWGRLDEIPPHLREMFVAQFPWRLELNAYQADVAAHLPPGVRVPELYDAHEACADVVALWMENVEPITTPWDLDRFARAAAALGRLAARRRTDRVAPFRPAEADAGIPGFALRYYVKGRVQHGALGPLSDDAPWGHPMLAGALAATGDRTLRRDLMAAATRLAELLDHLDTLPQTYAHGDASPQNLLVPADAPDTFVLIDWGFDSPSAIGFDLGQLLIGLAHAGELAVADLPAVQDAIFPAYLQAVRDEGMPVREADVYDGFVASMVVRSAFTALPLELLGVAPGSEGEREEIAAVWADRVRLTRYLLDLAATVPARG